MTRIAQMNFLDRLASYADRPTECWIWPGNKNLQGYGVVGWRGKNRGAHRLAYELLVGPVPEGMELDHLCRVRSCMNPAHLEPVTHRVNVVVRGSGPIAENVKKTHCKHGHEYTAANTMWQRNGRARTCRACQKVRNDRWNPIRHERRRAS